MKKIRRIQKIVFSLMIIFIFISSSVASAKIEKKLNLKNSKDIDDLLFDLKVRLYMRLLKSPSISVCVIKNDSIVWSKAYGYSNIYLREKATLESIYAIGSISKTITATAIMQILENDTLNINIDDNVSKWLPFDLKNPNFPNSNITFRMLLGHRSSLKDIIQDLFKISELNDNSINWIKDHLIPGGKYYKDRYWSDSEPGKNCSYSSFGFVILAALVEQITGEKFDDYCQKNIFLPLNMTNTSFEIERADKEKFARPYFPTLLGYIPFVHYDAKVLAACGGLRTNAIDLAHFLIAHMNNGTYKNVRILKNSTVEAMHSLYDPEDQGYWFHGGIIKFGLGWAHLEINGKHWEGYNGGAVGYSCDMATIKSEKVGVIILSNNHFYRFMTPIYDRYQWHDPLATHLIKKAN